MSLLSRRAALCLAPAILAPAVPVAIACPALPRPTRRTIVVDLGHGATATVTLLAGEPGDDQHQPPLLKMSATIDLGPNDDKQTVQVVFSGGGHPDDRRGDYLASPEASEAGWREIAGGGYITAAVRPIA